MVQSVGVSQEEAAKIMGNRFVGVDDYDVVMKSRFTEEDKSMLQHVPYARELLQERSQDGFLIALPEVPRASIQGHLRDMRIVASSLHIWQLPSRSSLWGEEGVWKHLDEMRTGWCLVSEDLYEADATEGIQYLNFLQATTAARYYYCRTGERLWDGFGVVQCLDHLASGMTDNAFDPFEVYAGFEWCDKWLRMDTPYEYQSVRRAGKLNKRVGGVIPVEAQTSGQ